VRIPPAATWDFLTHTTRACVGPWPDQSRDDFIDSLLDGRPDADHSPLAALVRIVTQRRLIASSLAIRGRYRIVSFTAVPLAELPRLRVFRSHRSRWDFEPYGICIRREWLERRGAQPVRYGGEPDWQRMAEPDRPFFQLVRRVDRGEFGRRHTPEQLADQTAGRPFTPTISPGEARESGLATGDAAGNAERVAIDWTVEHEWRHLGDLDLSALGRDEALLFVPDEEKARLLLEFSPWPVTVYRL
jgi:hypothetical protein